METELKPKKERKPPTERQAFTTWVVALVVIGMGIGVAVCGLNGAASRAIGDSPPSSIDFLVVGALTVFVGALILRSVPRSLKPVQRFAKDKAAVSPVIAVVLMVAITVVLAAVVFVLVSDIGQTNPPSPSMGFAKDESRDELVVTSVSRNGMVWDEFRVAGCVAPASDSTVDAGDLLTGCAGQVLVVHRASNTLVYSTRFE